jgi:hypothetical protein
MKEKKRLEIMFETHELTIVRFGRNQAADYCPFCGAHTPHLSVAQSVSVLALPETKIFLLAQSGQIHSRETADGRLSICGNSLAALKHNKKE